MPVRFRVKRKSGSMRWVDRDYGAPGTYFVTVKTAYRVHFFGEVIDGEMRLSRIGRIAHDFWAAIPDHFPGATIDRFVVMPHHVHGIVIINTPCEKAGRPSPAMRNASPRSQAMSAISPKAGSLSVIVRTYKMAVTRWCRQNGYHDFGWKNGYYDRIVPDSALSVVRWYIAHNPRKWWVKSLERWK